LKKGERISMETEISNQFKREKGLSFDDWRTRKEDEEKKVCIRGGEGPSL